MSIDMDILDEYDLLIVMKSMCESFSFQLMFFVSYVMKISSYMIF